MQSHETQLQHMLTQLRTRLLVMGASVQIALDEACTALETGNLGRARTVSEGDEAINALEDEIDELALAFLARFQPVAQDLRFAVAALRIVGEFERIGDEAVSIAERVIIMHGAPSELILNAVRPLMQRAQDMYRDALTALKTSDADAALILCGGESESTQLEVTALHQIVDNVRLKGDDEHSPYEAMHGILICRAFNRICRRSANIAEQTCFILQGVNIKHKKDSERFS